MIVATIDSLNARLAGTVVDTDIMYVGVPGDADPDRKISVAEAKKLFAKQLIIMDVSRSESANVSVATDVYTFEIPYGFTITNVVATVATAPVGADMVIDVSVGTTSIFSGSNVLTIDDGEFSSSTSASPAVISDGVVAAGSSIVVDVSQVGSSTAGAGLKVVLVGYFVLPLPMVLEFAVAGDGDSVLIPLKSGVNVDVDWGDGSVESFTTDDPTHTYAVAGTYTVRVSGSALTLGGTSSPSADWTGTVTAVRSFGDVGFTSFDNAFRDVTANVAMPTVIPSTVTNMSGMFLGSSFNQDIGAWDVSSVQDMEAMFLNANAFNQDVGAWNVGIVGNMKRMFRNSSFNQDIGAWDVSSVQNMQEMFYDTPFNQDIGSWDVSSVTDMISMFRNADAFDQDISGWDFSGLNSSSDLTFFMRDADGLSTTNYDALLIAWSDAADASTIFSPLSPNMGGSTYTAGGAAETARNNLVNNYSWNITDGGTA